ncbi:phytanoyl-CoA dioxygenase family protein [Nonomuraea angiospora]|uniref:Ectoine hydroxylase-related dioxygenase (Phytanoyl-CoA dioxygenase family) n=1 Tax=Nonomuraea angiospora TaxID=46172 RepID=A0ABR9ML08_9ACTN|nr:phytanoyl-CoA dioxygenase family protein [Nonomuraea angiospora]MBE1593627.1 ectoine hydroxylase-related dioxygenase (phytanoyl-CoA dioxygenase family) [Nonomuraea angiospora]
MTDSAMVRFYQDNGYLLVKGLLGAAEARAYREECHAVLGRLRPSDPTWGSAREIGGAGTELRHCHDAQFHSAAFARLMVDPRFTDVAAALMGSENVQLHHTKIFVKPAEKGSPFPMHQDAAHFPHTRHTVGAAIFHFDAAPEEKGCVRVVPGSHRNGPLPHLEEGGWHLPLREWPLEAAVPVEAEAGDVLFLSYLTVHGSGVNRADEARTTLLIQYRDPEDQPADDVHRSRGQGMMLRGIDPTG